ncbi:Gfo/Idh/MocA family protein [Paenibacillus solisilvae]|uniref:Gfo/Idh/MocA family protein n=1 Tax=Paenibacillus solisilvae TaxID=2486751 RepID=A0ABW0VUZ8_9BACL
MNVKDDQTKVRLGVIGLGGRGRGLLGALLEMKDVEIAAVCDLYDDRLRMGVDQVVASGRQKPGSYSDYKELLARDDIKGVIIPSSWSSHVEIAIAAMKAGKYAAPEAGGASSLEECWDLVRTSEETGMPCMMLENVCYGRNEMALINMIKKGLFGELIHCQSGYEHDLRDEVALGIENRHYRIHNYLNRNADIYPTHGIGPVSKFLGINRSNRFLSLTSMASKARGLHEWIADHRGTDHPMAKAEFAQGDIVTTMIKCAQGETVLLTHDTTLPRPYSRAGRVQGTKGIWMEDNNSIHLQGKSPEHTWESFDPYREENEHPLWKEYISLGVRGGHGGMDYLCLRSFVESVKMKISTPIDVYDTAAWMAVTALSEQSIALGGSSVAFPDFTNGKWINRTPGPKSKYSLDEVDDSLFFETV